jgi:uncharacterized phage-like protein YoqJ
MTIIAATGHRPDKLALWGESAYSPEQTQRLVRFAQQVLTNHQPSTVITGMALGWDMAIAQAAMSLQIPFHAYIPFKGQELMWPASTRLYYQALLRHAQHIVVCSGGGFTKTAMQKRNMDMVDNCDFLVALWNGSKGGTANCLDYAREVNRPFQNHWVEWVTFSDPQAPSIALNEDWLS